MTLSRRAAGLLLHPTSLPGRFGVGDLGPEADAFLEWAWRIPFLFSAVMVIVGLWVRLRLVESDGTLSGTA